MLIVIIHGRDNDIYSCLQHFTATPGHENTTRLNGTDDNTQHRNSLRVNTFASVTMLIPATVLKQSGAAVDQ